MTNEEKLASNFLESYYTAERADGKLLLIEYEDEYEDDPNYIGTIVDHEKIGIKLAVEDVLIPDDDYSNCCLAVVMTPTDPKYGAWRGYRHATQGDMVMLNPKTKRPAHRKDFFWIQDGKRILDRDFDV